MRQLVDSAEDEHALVARRSVIFHLVLRYYWASRIL